MNEISRQDARQQLLLDPAFGPALGFFGNATAVAALALTDPVNFGGSARNLNFFKGQGRVVFPQRGDNDRERDAEALTWGGAGILNLSGPSLSFAPAGSEYYEFWRRGYRWNRVNEAWQLALWEVFHEESFAVSQILVDGAVDDADYGAWVASNTDLTFTFSPSAAHNFTGSQSLLLTYGGALDTNYLSQSSNFYLQAGERFWMAGLAKLVSGAGPITWDIYNNTTGLRLESQVVAPGVGRWYHLGGQYTAPTAGNYNLRLGATHGSTVAWDSFPNHFETGVNWDVPGRIDANYKLRRIDEYHYERSLGKRWDDASSRHFDSWRKKIDFATETLDSEANPGGVQLLPPHKSMPMTDLYYRALRPLGDTAIIDENTPVPGDATMLMAAFKAHILEMVESVRPLGPGGQWRQLQKGYQATVDAQREVTEEETTPHREPRRSRMAV